MKEHYSIGETAKLLGISTQTLRFYDKIGLISPSFTATNTGYRFYSFNQFHYIDRIKYLQKLGMPLKDIKAVLNSGEVRLLLDFLEKKKKESLQELSELQSRIKGIDWYIDYFTYLAQAPQANLYKTNLNRRSVLQVPCYGNDRLEDMEIRLAKLKSQPQFEKLRYLRQYGYKLDSRAFRKTCFRPSHYFIYIKDESQLKKALLSSDSIDVLPAGEYLCLRARILEESWDPSMLPAGDLPSDLILALEFEDNLVEYSHAMYEIQILVQES